MHKEAALLKALADPMRLRLAALLAALLIGHAAGNVIVGHHAWHSFLPAGRRLMGITGCRSLSRFKGTGGIYT